MSWLNMKKHDRDLVHHDLLLYDRDVLARAFRCDDFTLHLLTRRFLQMPLLNISSAPTPMYLDYIKVVSCLQRQQGEAQAPVHLLQFYKDLWISVLFGDDVEEEDSNDKEEDHLEVCPPFTATELKKTVACADIKQRYFSGPWSFLVFLVVIFTVGMTEIQTVLTGIQTYK
ncbi:hypothetical protein FXO38_26628 [Capsicum annuum]|nr:hypothetical protein FXO38_26628 [Capsicum annuum]